MTVRLRGSFSDPTTAQRIVAALRADNPSFVTVEADGSDIEVRLTASSAASARTTFDDLLACLRAAEHTASERSVTETPG